MSKSIKEKYIERIGQLLEKGINVKATHKQPMGSIGLPSLDTDAFFEWKSGVENLIVKITGENSAYYKNFIAQVNRGHKEHVDAGIGILRAVKEDLELGYMEKIKDLVLAEVFTDFLDIAKHLLDNGYKDPTASLVGAVLEDGLRKISEKNNIQVKRDDDIGSLNTKLADAEIYNRLTQKQIQAWKAIRDNADHGRFNEYKTDDVKAMIDGVGRFLEEHISRK